MSQLSDKYIANLKKNYPKTVGKRIASIRKNKNITQTELANATGKDRQYIYKIEKGKVTINIVTLKIMTDALQINLHDFFKDW